MNCGLPRSSVHEISKERILEWAAISFSKGSSWPRDWTQVCCIGRWILYHWAAREVQWFPYPDLNTSRAETATPQRCPKITKETSQSREKGRNQELKSASRRRRYSSYRKEVTLQSVPFPSQTLVGKKVRNVKNQLTIYAWGWWRRADSRWSMIMGKKPLMIFGKASSWRWAERRRWASQGPGKIHSSEQGWKYFLTGEPNSTPVEHQFTLNRRICFWALSFVPLIYRSVFMRLPYWLDHHKLVLSFEVRIFKSSNFFHHFQVCFRYSGLFIRRNLGSACQFFFLFLQNKGTLDFERGENKEKVLSWRS